MRRAALVLIGLTLLVVLAPLWWWARGVNGEHRADTEQPSGKKAAVSSKFTTIPSCPNRGTTTTWCRSAIDIDYGAILRFRDPPPVPRTQTVYRPESPCSAPVSSDVHAALQKQLRRGEHFVTEPECGSEVGWVLVLDGQDHERILRVRRTRGQWVAEP